MKRIKHFIGIVIIILSCPAIFAQENLFDKIETNGNFSFEPLKIATSSMNEFTASSNLQADGYYFTLDNNKLNAFLPYVGSMLRIDPSASTNAIEIDSEIKDYQTKVNSKNTKLLISFSAYSKKSHEQFEITITITSSGSADLSIRSRNRDYISYLGKIVPGKK